MNEYTSKFQKEWLGKRNLLEEYENDYEDYTNTFVREEFEICPECMQNYDIHLRNKTFSGKWEEGAWENALSISRQINSMNKNMKSLLHNLSIGLGRG